MKYKQSTKYRLILTLSDQDIAFERLYSELLEIDNKFSDSESINYEKRKLFLRILLTYCNPHTSNSTNAYTGIPAHASVDDPPTMQAPSPPPIPPPATSPTTGKEVVPPSGLRKADGRIHFGDLKIEIN